MNNLNTIQTIEAISYLVIVVGVLAWALWKALVAQGIHKAWRQDKADRKDQDVPLHPNCRCTVTSSPGHHRVTHVLKGYAAAMGAPDPEWSPAELNAMKAMDMDARSWWARWRKPWAPPATRTTSVIWKSLQDARAASTARATKAYIEDLPVVDLPGDQFDFFLRNLEQIAKGCPARERFGTRCGRDLKPGWLCCDLHMTRNAFPGTDAQFERATDPGPAYFQHADGTIVPYAQRRSRKAHAEAKAANQKAREAIFARARDSVQRFGGADIAERAKPKRTALAALAAQHKNAKAKQLTAGRALVAKFMAGEVSSYRPDVNAALRRVYKRAAKMAEGPKNPKKGRKMSTKKPKNRKKTRR